MVNPRKDIEKDLEELLKDLNTEFLLFSKNKNNITEMWTSYKELIQEIRNYLDEGFEEGAYISVTTSTREQFYILLEELLSIQSQSS
ncbi:MAG: hypothetical protein U5K55_03500 [Aliarcobacter sp.]|nr:hypothetical protein [Aliarcobacter sp.]